MKFPYFLPALVFLAACGADHEASAATTSYPARLLFDVNFEADSIGSPAALGGPPNSASVRQKPTALNFGSTLVVAARSGTSSQAVQLFPRNTGTFRYAQLQFNTGEYFPAIPTEITRKIEVQFDLLLGNVAGPGGTAGNDGSRDEFTLLIDSPESHRIDFRGGNEIYLDAPLPVRIGGFLESVMHRYSVINYLDENRMEVWQDGALLYSGLFHRPYPAAPTNPTAISSYRLSLTDGTAYPGSPVALVDNLSIRFVPEPSTPMFAAAAGLFAVSRRRRPEH